MQHPITRIKNCGLASVEEAAHAIATGASFLGFVHYPPSPRHLPLAQITAITDQSQEQAKNVLVTVKPDDTLLQQISAIASLHYLQIHGITDIARIQEIRALAKKPLIIGLGVAGEEDIHIAHHIAPHADFLLFDYKTDQHGGSGQSFNWALLQNQHFSCPWFLAGGLTAKNVTDAITKTGATLVDVSSGIEEAPGKKSLKKIAAFNARVLNSRA